MRLRNFVPVLFAAFALFSCASSKKTTGSVSRDKLKGTWQLDNISYEGLPEGQKVKLTILDEGTETCLKGSMWVFPNNGNGSYTINSSEPGCSPGQRNIVWSYRVDNEQPIFQYKRLPGGVKAEDVLEGYKFTIVDASGESLNLRSNVNFEGNKISINYQ
ncbi:MAG TPA: lipocalin family protein, partial [Chitinophagaceae bacterium]|nr:lipocalin family protein [Chitinophagaceae bacterium]